MYLLRTVSTRGLVLLAAAVVALIGGVVIAVAAGTGSASPPPSKPLAGALLDAARAPHPAGITARITFTNHLLPSGSFAGEVGSPLMSGASGRLWLRDDGRGRLELQSLAGDAQIFWTPTDVTVYDASSNTVYHSALPATPKRAGDSQHVPPTLAQVEDVLAKLGEHALVSAAEPLDVAGRPAYQAGLSPKDHPGLVGSLQLAWDAVHGVPLRAALFAKGGSNPVLELKASQISYRAVPESYVSVTPPADAKTVELTAPSAKKGKSDGTDKTEAIGLEAVRAAAGFPVTAPGTLGSLARQDVRLAGSAVVVRYGQGLDSLVLVERKAEGALAGQLGVLPTVQLGGGAAAHELQTPLGTALVWRANGVDYVLAGSVPAGTAEEAARGLR